MTDGAAPRSLPSRVSLRRLVLVLPIALILIWLIARQVVLLLLAASPDLPVQPLWPVSGATVIATSDIRTLAGIKHDTATADRLRHAVVDDPLAPEPFFAAALVSIKQRDRAAAIRLLEQARRREPRWVAPRLMLAQQYLLAGRIDGAISEIAGITRLSSNIGGQLIQALAPLGNDPRTRPMIIAAMRRDPNLRRMLVDYVTSTGGDAAFLFKSLVATPDAGAIAGEQAALVNMLVTGRDYQRAYLAWINFLPESALSGIAFVYDGNFAGLPGPPPFNWQLFADGAGNAELTRKSGLPQGTALDANYFSEQPSTMAQQTIVLEPGSYIFSYSVTGSHDGDTGGTLGWTLHCLDKPGTELLRSALLPSAPTRVDVRFAVPATGCAAQQLSLVGTSGDVPATYRAEYSGLTVTRQSRAAPTPTEQGAPS